MIERVSISLDVPDIEAAVEFYTRGLGFEPKSEPSAHPFVLETAGFSIELLQRAPDSLAIPGESVRRTYDRHWTPLHLDLVVDDLDMAIESVNDAGGRIHTERIEVADRWIEVRCADPFGHGFCLIQRVH